MKAIFRNRQEVQKLSGPVALAIDELVSAINVQPLEVGDSKIRSGIGTPEGRLIGSPGDLYLRTDGASGTTLYRKDTGKRSVTGWVPTGGTRGTWTATDGSGAGLALTQAWPAIWAAMPLATGRLVTVSAAVLYPATGSGAGAVLAGLPFVCGGTPGAGALGYTSAGLAYTLYVKETTSQVWLYTLAGAQVTNVQLTGAYVMFTATYFAI